MRSTKIMRHIECSIEHPRTFLSSQVVKRTIFNKGFVFLMFLDMFFTLKVWGRFAKISMEH